MKKLILTSLIMLIGTFSLTNENTEKSYAEDNVVNVVPGFASSIANANNEIDFNSTNETIINNKYIESDELEIYDYNTDLMDSIIDYARSNNLIVSGETLTKSTDESNNIRKPMNKSAYWDIDNGSSTPDRFSFFTQKSTLGLLFNDWDLTNNQPLEFKINMGDTNWLITLKEFLKKYAPNELTIPLISINNTTILEATKSNNELTLKSNNARVYLITSNSGSIINSDVLIEIPFINYIESITSLYISCWSDEMVTWAEPQIMEIVNPISLYIYTYANSTFSPIIFSDFDFKKGTLITSSGISRNRYILDSITINDNLEITTAITNIKIGNTELTKDSKLYNHIQQYNLLINNQLFNYENDVTGFFNYLKNSEDKVFNITSYKYHYTIGRSDEEFERLESVLDDFNASLDPTNLVFNCLKVV